MTVFGMMLYPVTTKSETDMLDQIDTAMLFDNPLSPDGEIWKAALDASNTADQSALLSQYDAGAGEAYIGHLHPVETVHLFTSSARWGLPIGQSWGRVVYRRTGEGSFSGRLVLDGLPPERTYVLCLNSFEDHESGRHLPQVYEDERYYDFEQIRTDADGAVDKTFSVALPPAAYHVKFLVKDPSDWRVMLHSDFVRFEVTPGATSSDISAPGGEALP